MMSFLGANTDQLRQHGELCTRRGAELQQLGHRLHTAALSMDWIGPDAEGFRERAHSVLLTDFVTMSRTLQQVGTDLHREAEQQDTASGEQEAGASPDSSRPGLPSTGVGFLPADGGVSPLPPGHFDDEPGDGDGLPHSEYDTLPEPGAVRPAWDEVMPPMDALPLSLQERIALQIRYANRAETYDAENPPFNPGGFDYETPRAGDRLGPISIVENHENGDFTIELNGEHIRMNKGAPLPGQYEQEVRDILGESYDPWVGDTGYYTFTRDFTLHPDGTIVQTMLPDQPELPPGATPYQVAVGDVGVRTAAYFPAEGKVYEAPPAPYALPKTPNPTLPEARPR